jgi:hypothetical protein
VTRGASKGARAHLETFFDDIDRHEEDARDGLCPEPGQEICSKDVVGAQRAP